MTQAGMAEGKPPWSGAPNSEVGTKFAIPTFLAKLDYREGRKKMT